MTEGTRRLWLRGKLYVVFIWQVISKIVEELMRTSHLCGACDMFDTLVNSLLNKRNYSHGLISDHAQTRNIQLVY